MDPFRRGFLKWGSLGMIGASTGVAELPGAHAEMTHQTENKASADFDVRIYGATGNGKTIDSPAINKAIEAANTAGGGVVRFPSGTYVCYSIHLKSNVALYLEPGATILGASIPKEGLKSGGYDAPEPNKWDQYQDFGHSHWHNSLIWGEDIHDFAILGPGRIWGKGLSRGSDTVPSALLPGMADKAIALKNCHNVLLRDFSILEGGHFGILATGVDNFTIDNLAIDTNQDGIDIDCCQNVRVSKCSVNSPADDAIVPKSSYALGYARTTKNLTISDCYVTGAFHVGTMLDGTQKRFSLIDQIQRTQRSLQEFNGSIKLGTESNGGFKDIAISNCIFDASKGFAIESSDGAAIEDITFSGITMRDCMNTPLFLRLGARMRAPAGTPVGTLKRIILSNIVSSNSVSRLGGGGIIAGIPGHAVEDIKINDVYVEHQGGGTNEMAALIPGEHSNDHWKGGPMHPGIHVYPDPDMFGNIPASGFFLQEVKNIEFTNVEVAFQKPDARPIFWMKDVDGAEFFNVKSPRGRSALEFRLHNVHDFTVRACRNVKDMSLDAVQSKEI